MGDNIINIIIGILLLVVGPILITLYQNLKKENKTGGLSFKLQVGGIGCIILGAGLIIHALKNIYS